MSMRSSSTTRSPRCVLAVKPTNERVGASDVRVQRVVLVEIGTTDQDMALEIFETMNGRGLRLSNTDMLKGFLLARIGEADEIAKANPTATDGLLQQAKRYQMRTWE